MNCRWPGSPNPPKPVASLIGAAILPDGGPHFIGKHKERTPNRKVGAFCVTAELQRRAGAVADQRVEFFKFRKTSTRVPLAAGTYAMPSALELAAWGVLRAPCRELQEEYMTKKALTNGCDFSFVCRSGACRGILRRAWARPSLHGYDHETHRANHDYPNRPARV